MTGNLPHADCFKKRKKALESSDGTAISVYKFSIDKLSSQDLVAWAKHFRNHYCLDETIDLLRNGTGKSRASYLTDMVFPDKAAGLGPATRSGDFAEILVADLLETKFGYWVPRFRYENKMVRNDSPKGADIVGFKFATGSPNKPSENDALIAVETKAQASGTKPLARLQDAVDDSIKDKWRIGETLNAMKRRLIERQEFDSATKVQRFQEGIKVPYRRRSGAAAVFCSAAFDETKLANTDCSKHENLSNLRLVVVHSKDLMKLVHAMYERASNEA